MTRTMEFEIFIKKHTDKGIISKFLQIYLRFCDVKKLQ